MPYRVGWSTVTQTTSFCTTYPADRPVVGTAQMVSSLSCHRSPGRSWEGAGWPVSLALAVQLLHHETFGVNEGEAGQAILTVAMPKPPAFHIDVILPCTKVCVSLSLLLFCSEAFLKPRPGSRLDSLNGQEPDRTGGELYCGYTPEVITCRNWALWKQLQVPTSLCLLNRRSQPVRIK